MAGRLPQVLARDPPDLVPRNPELGELRRLERRGDGEFDRIEHPKIADERLRDGVMDAADLVEIRLRADHRDQRLARRRRGALRRITIVCSTTVFALRNVRRRCTLDA